MTAVGGVLVPELWWDPQAGFAHLDALIDDALELGARAFRIRGGPAATVHALAEELHRRAPEPVLLAMEVEGGVGGRVPECTALPPLAALAALRDTEAIRRAAALTARELRLLGVNWALGPVADLMHAGATSSRRAECLGEDPQRVAEDVVAWVDACQALGVLAGARHFPGIGRVVGDHTQVPLVIDGEARTLWDTDLVPFRGAVDAGVASLLVSAVRVPGLDRSGTMAMHSAPILQGLLRETLGFEGMIVGDRLEQGSLGGPEHAAEAAVAAVVAGCDLVLAPDDLEGMVEALTQAMDAGILAPEAVEASARRRRFWAAWAVPRAVTEPSLETRLWARQIADLVAHPVRGTLPPLGGRIEVGSIDAGMTARRAPRIAGGFMRTLQAAGLEVRDGVAGDGDDGAPDDATATVLALFPSASGRFDEEAAIASRIETAVAAARARQRPAIVVVFGPPEVARAVEAPVVLCAWSDDRAMQEGSARRLLG